jgi:glycosyltransferase involved in cell wall biosynthesis
MNTYVKAFNEDFSFSLKLFRRTIAADYNAPSIGSMQMPSDIPKPVIPIDLFRIGVVIPTLNEEKNLVYLLSQLRALGFKNVLIIDGKSKDRTVEVARRHSARVVIQKGKGKGNAVKEVLSNNFLDMDAVVLMDADGSMSPEEIPLFIQALNSGADVVKGSRFMKGGGTCDMTLTRKIGNFFFLIVVNLLWSTKYTDLCYGFAVFNKLAIAKIAPVLKSQNFEIETEVFIKATKLGLVVKEMPSVELERRFGRSNLKTFLDGLKIFITIMKEFLVED